jgi:hypothetical protein
MRRRIHAYAYEEEDTCMHLRRRIPGSGLSE